MANNELARELGKYNKEKGALSTTTLEQRITMYAEAFVNGKNKRDAYAAAGYSCPTFSNAANFHNSHLDKINKEISKHIHSKVPTALKVLDEIMTHGKSETARVKAALEILERGGFTRDVSVQFTNEDPKTREELSKQLKDLLSNNPEVLFLEKE